MTVEIAWSYAPVLTSRPWTHLILLSLMYQQMSSHIIPGFKHFVTIRPNAGNGEVVRVKSRMSIQSCFISKRVFTSWPITFILEFTMNRTNMSFQMFCRSEGFTTVLVSAPIVKSSGVSVLCVLIETILTLEWRDTSIDRTYERPVSRVFGLMN